MTVKSESLKNWCKGFCRTCGTGCGQYCEQIAQLREDLRSLGTMAKQMDVQCAASKNELVIENERLRRALEDIGCGDLELGESHPLARLAREALGNDPVGDTDCNLPVEE